jgi:hypothetical protein
MICYCLAGAKYQDLIGDKARGCRPPLLFDSHPNLVEIMDESLCKRMVTDARRLSLLYPLRAGENGSIEKVIGLIHHVCVCLSEKI